MPELSAEEKAAKWAKTKARKAAKKALLASGSVENLAAMDEDEAAADAKRDKKAKKRKAAEAAAEEGPGTPGSSDDEKKKAKKAKKAKKDKADALDFFAPIVADAKAPAADSGKKKWFEDEAKPAAEAAAAAPATAEEFFKLHNITLKNEPSGLAPALSWEAVPFDQALVKPLSSAGFSAPSPIQALAWPLASKGRDLIAVAKTGSGKTLGFLVPAFAHLAVARPVKARGDAPLVLVLAPTRELAVQIEDECLKFGKAAKVRSTCCYGGAPKSTQIRALQSGVDVLVATPGRLNDLLEMKRANVSKVAYLVFDEADRMLDMGFEPQIRDVLKHCPEARQTLFFTATWPKVVQKLAATFLNEPVQVNIGDTETLTASKSITQTVRVLGGDRDKWDALLTELKNLPSGHKTLIFSATKQGCNEVADALWKDGAAVDALHGDKMQWERTACLDKFRSGQLSLIVATDVAARGLDIDGITHVINYDFPAGHGAVEDYVHRIGRCGRGRNLGEAITFFTAKEGKHAAELVQIMMGADQTVPPDLQALVRPSWGKERWGKGGGKGKGGRGGGGKGSGKGRGGGGGGGYGRW